MTTRERKRERKRESEIIDEVNRAGELMGVGRVWMWHVACLVSSCLTRDCAADWSEKGKFR